MTDWTKFNGARRGVTITQIPDWASEGYHFSLEFEGLIFEVGFFPNSKTTDDQVSEFLDKKIEEILSKKQ